MTKLLAKSAFLLAALANLLPCRAQLNPPVFSPPAGTYSRPFTLAMTADSGTTIYYTTDGTAPSPNSNVYSGPITINAGTTTVQAIAISGALTYYIAPSPVTSATYTVAPPASTTQLKSSASTVALPVLPGALTLTATVNPTASGGAVPSGNVNFYSNISNLLGTEPLQIIPSSQAWTGEAVLGTPISYPAGIASVVLAKGAQPVLVSAQSPYGGTATVPNVALYKLSSGGTTLNAYTYTNPNQSTTDAVVAGYFLQPASLSVQSFLVHEYGDYEVFDGSTTASGDGLGLNAPITSPSGFFCDCPQPDSETLSVADFDNDGYDDLGVLIDDYGYYDPYSGYFYYYDRVAGVAINSGSSGAGNFNFVEVTAPSSITSPTVFCPVAITTGHFTSSAGAQLAVLASTPQTSCSNTANGPFAVYLFAYDATNKALNAIGTPLALPDNNASILAAADLNNDGISDLIIGEYIPGTHPFEVIKAAAGTSPGGGILTALSAGDGSFKAPSALYSVPAAPVAFTVNDFNADGNIDVAYTSINGYSVLWGDGAGNFSSGKDYSTGVGSAPTGITSGDFNGDSLADLAIAPGYSNIDIELNSASAQAVLPLGPHALAAGSYSLTAVFPGDPNFATSTSPAVDVKVSQTTPVITWTGSGGTLKYGTPLSGDQLNATASVQGTFTYTPGLGAILPPGNNVVKAAFAPTDSFDYAPASATLSITVGPPVLSSITPTSANVGSSDTTITAIGMGFLNGAVVTFNGTALATTFVDLNHLTAVIPPSLLTSPGSATIAAVDPGGLAVTGSATFSITVGTPTLASIAPTSVNAGSSDTTITVTGGGLVNGAAVTFNGTALATTFVDLNHLTAVIPARLLTAPASAKVAVVNPGNLAGTGSATFSITVGTPVLASITPTSANVGSSDTTITVTGAGFVNGAVVTFSGTALATTFVDLNHLTAVIPAKLLGAPASAKVAVVNPGNLAGTGSATFSITVGTPTLAGIAPTSVNAGSSDTMITVTGAGFVNGAAVTFNGKVLATAFVDLNHLTAVIPAKLLGAPASAKVAVVNPGNLAGTGSATFSITVGTPSLASIAPISVNVGNTDISITVTGMGFVNGAVVTFNGTALATTYVDLQHLTAVIPAKLLAAPASAKVAVANPGNLAGTGSATFSITVGTPSLASIAPTSVNVGNTDTMITATGMSFVNGSVVTFNGTALATTYVDLQHLTAMIPAKLLGAPASATIAVVNPGNLAGTGSATFSIKAPSAVATVTTSETTLTAGQQSTITLTVDPYPVPVTATATLTFTPAPPNTVQDPVVLFSNNETTETVTINPGSTTSSNDFPFQAGSTAGTITFTIQLTLGNGQDVTPSNIEPVTVTVPASPPDIKSALLTRSGQSLQILVGALSSTRDVTEAHFHFTPVSGKSLATSDVTVQLTSVFQGWFSSSTSDQYGTNFTYTQPFTLDGDATDIQSVSITLVNSAGTSEAATAQ